MSLQTLAFFLRHTYWKISDKIIGIVLTAIMGLNAVQHL
jgi:hypothetical protein